MFSKISGWKDIRPKKQFKPWNNPLEDRSKKTVKKKR